MASQEQIGLQVKPVEERRDMYIVSPSKPLDKGFYVLYIGSFGGEMGMGGIVYNIVVGSVKDFPSYAAAVESAQDQFKGKAAVLLSKMNELLDRHDYAHLQEVYRPNGKVLAGAELGVRYRQSDIARKLWANCKVRSIGCICC